MGQRQLIQNVSSKVGVSGLSNVNNTSLDDQSPKKQKIDLSKKVNDYMFAINSNHKFMKEKKGTILASDRGSVFDKPFSNFEL